MRKDSLESLRKSMDSAGELASVVRTMKALAAASLTQYENAVHSLADYYISVERGLALSFRSSLRFPSALPGLPRDKRASGIIVFGSDMGLVGRFNEWLWDYIDKNRGTGNPKKIFWTVGERIYSLLQEQGFLVEKKFQVPGSVNSITKLIGRLLEEINAFYAGNKIDSLYIIYNKPLKGTLFKPVQECVLPLDEVWQNQLAAMQWPGSALPEMTGDKRAARMNLIKEFLFVSFYRACAGSLAAENASRLAAMQRAEKNISELMEDLRLHYHRLRQDSIDEELFDVVAGAEALRRQ